MEHRGGTQDFETSHLAVLPVEHDAGLDALGRINRDAIPARRQLLIRQIDLRRIHLGIVSNPHGPIIHGSRQGSSVDVRSHTAGRVPDRSWCSRPGSIPRFTGRWKGLTAGLGPGRVCRG